MSNTKQPIGYRVKWKLDGASQSQIVDTIEKAIEVQGIWLLKGASTSISPAYKSPLFNSKK
jgi:hypothetical protein